MSGETPAKVLSVTSFAGNICYDSAITWSEDNRIAVTTLKGIHIWTVQFKPHTRNAKLHFERSFIPAPTVINQYDIDISRETIHEKLENNRELLYEFMLDKSLSPAAASQQNFKGYRMAKWSRKEASSTNKCLLATLTMDYRFELYYSKEQTWQKIADLSSLFHSHVKNRNYEDCIAFDAESLSQGEALFRQYKQRTNTLLTTEFVWTNLFVKEKKPGKNSDYSRQEMPTDRFSMLITAMKSGQIVLWKILTTPNAASAIEVLAIFDSEMGAITSMVWHQLNNTSGLLIVGSHEGKVRAFLTTVQFTGRTGIVDFKVVNALWIWNFADRLSVSQIGIRKSRENLFYVVAGRGSYLMACEMEVKEDNLLMKYQSFCVGCHRLPLSGICQVGDSFLVSSTDGCMQSVNLEITKAGLKINHNSVSFESLNPCQKSLRGVASSPSQVFVCTVGRQMGFFDHLIIKEPIDLTVFTTMALKDSMNLMLTNDKNLSAIRDILEHVRLFLSVEDSLPTEITKLTSLDSYDLEMADHLLMLIRWWLKWLVQGNPNDIVNYNTRINTIEEILLKRQLFRWLKVADTGSLNGCKSVHTVCQWLLTRSNLKPAEEAVITRITSKKLYKAFLKDQGLTEKCAICQENIIVNNIWKATCPNGHSFGRCSMTLHICDQTVCKKCVSCDALAQETNEKSRCVFCDGEMKSI